MISAVSARYTANIEIPVVSEVPPLRPAATVIVLRDGVTGPEVFLVRRHHAVAFMAGAHVFPGGRVDSGDESANSSWCDGVVEATGKLPGVAPEAALAFHVAASRELFEEAGILLARDARRQLVSLAGGADRDRFKVHRAELNAGRRTLREIVEVERLRLALDTLVHYAHWVTPPIEIRRFDTRFFVTRVPSHQAPAHDDHEATDSVWIRPVDAIAAVSRGDIVLPPPTWASLRELQRFPTVDAALLWAQTRSVYRREPRVTTGADGNRRIVLPGDPSLPEPEPVAFETRFVLADGRWSPEPAA
jgi:8-oxo-dGTP pyrophosphatase MutT (NUDIX family)